MAGGSSGLDPCVIVVGDPCSEFVRETVRLAREYRVHALQCGDIYAAVAQTAAATGRRTMVVGTLKELARENGRLFALAAAHAARCCCLLDKGVTNGREAIVAALRPGASVIGEARQVRAVLEEWLAGGGRRPASVDLRDLAGDDLRATPAELDALLGQETDG
jgi:hypothetical protein